MVSSNNPEPAAAAAAPTPSRLYRGVSLEPDGLWAAHVTAGDRAGRLIGRFDKEHRAALAHDRVALFHGAAADAGAINFPPSFSAMERLFLRRHCTEEFVLRAVLDHTYDAEFEAFLRFAFDEYWWGGGDDGGEAARAVAGRVARIRNSPGWRRVADEEANASHAFVMGHLNPVLCAAWVPYFHLQGDPNRSFFTCGEAHEWEDAEAARRAKEQEEARQERPGLEATVAKAPAVAQEVAGAPELGGAALDRTEPEEQEARPDTSSRAMPRRRVPRPLRSFKRWLRRTCFFDDQSDREQRAPLLKPSRGRGHGTPSFEVSSQGADQSLNGTIANSG